MGPGAVRFEELRRDVAEVARLVAVLRARNTVSGPAGGQVRAAPPRALPDAPPQRPPDAPPDAPPERPPGPDPVVALQDAVGRLARQVDGAAGAAGRYERLVEASPDGLVETTAAGVVLHVNRRAAAMLGAGDQRLVGTPLAELVEAGDRRRFRRFLATRAGGRSGNGGSRASGVDVRLRGCRAEPFDAAMHVAEVEGGAEPTLLWTLRDMSDRHELLEQLTFHATHDHLTMVANRRHFVQVLARRLRLRATPERPIVVLFVDLDRFKGVNDRFGHPAGDELLAAAGERLRSLLRDGDLLGRIGGDEFAVALEDETGGAHGQALAERILVAVSAPFVLAEATVRLSASIGMAVATSGRQRADDVLRDADMAMYAAKEAGGNRWVAFDPDLRASAVARIDAETELRAAFEAGQFVVHYQPVVELAGGRLVGAEALLRWQHPERGLLAAEEFVADLESSGLIVGVGHWVLDQAAAALRRWVDAGAPDDLVVMVNVSPLQFAEGGFASVPAAAARRAGIAPHRLCVEVTERTAVEGGRHGVDTLQEVHRSGVRVALDDFGTGYSSLTYLHDLPVDVVKIDRTFTERLLASREDRLIMLAVVQLARTLGLTTVAEGAAAVEHVGALRAMGCEQAQGTYICPPVEDHAVAALVASGWHFPTPRRVQAAR